jgi:hypothetical protein
MYPAPGAYPGTSPIPIPPSSNPFSAIRSYGNQLSKGLSLGEFIGSLWGVHVYARDFGKSEVALARYLRGVGFKALQRTQKIL